WPCFYGIDFATRAELVANSLTVDQVGASLGADSLGYISIEGMIEATTLPESRLCTACFSGDYPIPLGDRKSTRLNSSHVSISYAVFCLKKKKKHLTTYSTL